MSQSATRTATKPAARTAKGISTAGFIRADELYTVNEFRSRLGIPTAAWSELRARKFPTIRSGKRTFVSGRKAIEFFESTAEAMG